MRKLVESIQIITRFAREIGNRTKLIVDFNFPNQKSEEIIEEKLTLLNSLMYMTLIDSVSFLDEYQNILGVKTEKNYKERIIITKAINKPLISRITEWKDLRDLRNNLLAHNLRKGKNGIFIFSIEGLDFNAPRTLNDIFLLSNLIQFATETINSEFEKEIETFESNTAKDLKKNNRILSKDDVSKITADLLNKANMIKKKYNRNYSFTINKIIDWNKV